MKEKQIEQLIQQLLTCGYHTGQITEIIREAIGKDTPARGSPEEQLLLETLESYVKFSNKCRMLKNL